MILYHTTNMVKVVTVIYKRVTKFTIKTRCQYLLISKIQIYDWLFDVVDETNSQVVGNMMKIRVQRTLKHMRQSCNTLQNRVFKIVT